MRKELYEPAGTRLLQVAMLPFCVLIAGGLAFSVVSSLVRGGALTGDMLASGIAILAFSYASVHLARELRAGRHPQVLAAIDDEKGVCVAGFWKGYAAWDEILGAELEAYSGRGGFGYTLYIEVPREVGERCLEDAPWGMRPVSQWRTERGSRLPVVSSPEKSELEPAVAAIHARIANRVVSLLPGGASR